MTQTGVINTALCYRGGEKKQETNLLDFRRKGKSEKGASLRENREY